MLSQKVCTDAHGQDSSYFMGWQEYEKNPYHATRNPDGIIQMGLAENQLSFDLLESWFANNKHVLALTDQSGKSVFRELALFQDYHGLPSFKNALVNFMAKVRGNRVKFHADNLVLTAGATSANETLMFCLANPGDAFLIPTPYYPGFDRDLKWRTGAEIVPVHCSSTNGFKITKQALEEAYQISRKLNLKVKGVLITNPSNPLGTTMDRQELRLLLDFVSAKKLHVVSDEIYSGTVFDCPGFTSIVEAATDMGIHRLDADMWRRIHVVYSLSKDLGLPGFRVGMIYSNDQAVVSAATKMSSFGLMSSQTQHMLSHLLSDKSFTDRYLQENQTRLKNRKEMLVSGLKAAGIECLGSSSGLFCWVDMRRLLRSQTFEAEKELWTKIVLELGLNISPGSSCHCSEPGWFRACFANMSEETLNVALERISRFVKFIGESRKKKTMWDSRRKSLINKWVSKLPSSNKNNAER